MPGPPTLDPAGRPTSGSRAVPTPPGLRFQAVVPSGSRSRSTGSRLATTTKSEFPNCEVCGFWRPLGAIYVSSFAGPIPSMDKKMRHSSASVAYAATTRLAWRAVLSASGSTSPISPGSDFVGMTQLYATQIFARRHLGLLPSAEVDYPPPPPAIGQLVLAVLLRCEHLFRGALARLRRTTNAVVRIRGRVNPGPVHTSNRLAYRRTKPTSCPDSGAHTAREIPARPFIHRPVELEVGIRLWVLWQDCGEPNPLRELRAIWSEPMRHLFQHLCFALGAGHAIERRALSPARKMPIKPGLSLFSSNPHSRALTL